jgi:hypothetical protein
MIRAGYICQNGDEHLLTRHGPRCPGAAWPK